jgi:hypothetical protein
MTNHACAALLSRLDATARIMISMETNAARRTWWLCRLNTENVTARDNVTFRRERRRIRLTGISLLHAQAAPPIALDG